MWLITLAILLLIAPTAYAAEVLDIEFKDSSERQLYHTTNLSKDLMLWYRQDFGDMKVLVIETPKLSEKKYQAQNDSLNALGHEIEELQVMFVTASTQEVDYNGYHTSRETAEKLSLGISSFRIRLLNSMGKVLKDSSQPVSTAELRRWLKRKY